MADLAEQRLAVSTPRQQPNGRDDAGFTLAEMLAALAILMTGITTLLLSLSDSVSLRRSTDMRLAAAQAVEDVLLRVQQTGIRRRADAATDLDLELAVREDYQVPGRPGLAFRVATEPHPHRADLWLVRLEATWLEAGEFMTEEFLRVLPVQLPMGVRVARFREETRGSVR